MRKPILYLAIGIPLFLLSAVFVYNLPPVHERLSWRLDNFIASVQYALNPPEQVVFVPQGNAAGGGGDIATMEAIVAATLQALPSATPSPSPAPTRPGPTATPTTVPTATSTPTPLPDKASLKGILHEYQKWNNCGPANLAMELSFWGWQGDQLDTAAVLKPNSRDKNVMPYEMVDFVQEHTGLKALARVGGDLLLIKSFLAAGFPVIVEKGFEGPSFDGWMGHYEVVSGYDEAKARFTTQDSYLGANLAVSYADMAEYWQAFNYLYIVVYPAEREAEVLAILGPQADEAFNYQYAAQLASQEIASKSGRDQFFAWYNRGTDLMYLQDYSGAADAYDQAFALYPGIPEKERPWRMLWYQTGPYIAYFFTQRYYDVVSLATSTIDTANEPAIEESFYWRARAFYELYKLEGKQDYRAHAVEDFQTSLKWHPDFAPSLAQLQDIGVSQ